MDVVVKNVCASEMRRKMFCCGVLDGKRSSSSPSLKIERRRKIACVQQGGRQADRQLGAARYYLFSTC